MCQTSNKKKYDQYFKRKERVFGGGKSYWT